MDNTGRTTRWFSKQAWSAFTTLAKRARCSTSALCSLLIVKCLDFHMYKVASTCTAKGVEQTACILEKYFLIRGGPSASRRLNLGSGGYRVPWLGYFSNQYYVNFLINMFTCLTLLLIFMSRDVG